MRDNVHRMMHEFQRVNHFPNSTELTRKDRMWENFQRMAQQHRELNFDFVPETFVLPQQLRSFKQRYLKTRSEQLWIVKPTASSQGRGIFILRNLVELPMKESVVVSRYVEKPLLIQGLKFDLRIYVMVTSFRPLRAYVYREGLTRFASKAYSTDEEHLADVYRHLTNYSINKGAENFQENQRVQADNYGHKWSLSALNRHLRCIGVNVKEMWSRIMDIIVKTLLAVEPAISAATKESCLHEQSCFELYGFDILVDEHLKPWLLEVNLSPSMQAESPLDKQIKSSLLSDDAFNLLGVKRLDAQTLTSARLRARFLYMSKLQSQMPKSKDSKLLGHRQDPLRPEEPRLEKTEERFQLFDRRSDRRPCVEPRLVRKYFSPKKQVSLSTLCEPHLRLLVYALEETQRCCNFIRLYPTPSTVKRYQPLTESRSMEDEFRNQLLTAVLFAQQMPLCDEPELEDKEPPPPEAELISAPEPEPVPKVAQEGNLQMVEEALQTLKVLGTKMSSQLLLMEYIVRLLNTCHQLSDGARRKLENRQQSAIAGVLQIFRQQLALYLRASERGARARAARRAAHMGCLQGSVVDDVEDICQQALVQILCNTWGGARDHAQRGVESLRGELSVVRQGVSERVWD
ncbi:Tubulin polyglutamylase TTLL5 (SRC1 and TIF2-associated modulatory protein) (Tubulin--tyrosine ligase-like protein 5) [Durusdinium trenchii]|uniref:Tubulin--tyrosine ligase-like protein 5 n=1 Tax=Durusdinium trenchii TaxID=1381693 RepID=A0ABP0KIW0_9DINO